MPGLPDLRDFVRAEPPPRGATILARGGPDSLEKLTGHAERLRRRYMRDGDPVLGVSVFAAWDDIGPASLDRIGPASLDGISSGKLATYRVVHLAALHVLATTGFTVPPTFGRPRPPGARLGLRWWRRKSH